MERPRRKADGWFALVLFFVCLLPPVGYWLWQMNGYVSPTGQRYIAQMTPGTSIELVGVSRGSDGQLAGEWWQPDGHRYADPIPTGPAGFGLSRGGFRVRSFHFSIRNGENAMPGGQSPPVSITPVSSGAATGISACSNSPRRMNKSLHLLPPTGRWEPVTIRVDIASRGREQIAAISDDELPKTLVVDGVPVEFLTAEDLVTKKRVLQLNHRAERSQNVTFVVSLVDDQTGADFSPAQHGNSRGRTFQIGSRADYTIRFSKIVFDRRVTFSNIAKNPEDFTRVDVSEVESLLPQ